jgi:hypothetical protein
MNKKIRQLNQDLRNGKLLDENIPQLFNHLANHYEVYASVRLAMHYYAFYEAFNDEEELWSKEAKDIIVCLNEIIKLNILQNQSGQLREDAIRQVDSIRKEIMKRMEILTAYTDIFQTFEYVLNRIEYRFKEEKEFFKDEEFAQEVLRYIFDSEDNMIINEKIKEMIGQLPIRITKQKYFDLLKESIWAYRGSDKSSFDTYLYMLRTSAMLYQTEGMDTYYPALWEKKEQLSSLEYKNLTKEIFDKAVNTLRAATFILETETTVYFGLQEIVNEVFALLLCAPYSGMVSMENDYSKNAAFAILKDINTVFSVKEKEDLTIDLMDKFTNIEGIQEDISEEISVMEDSLYEIMTNHQTLVQSLMLGQSLQVLDHSRKLLSNSIFIDLEEQFEEVIVDEDIVDMAFDKLEEELRGLFANADKVIGRAVMANTLNKMPVFFNDHKEVMNYVRYSIERCSDSYEKLACYEIINAIMSE